MMKLTFFKAVCFAKKTKALSHKIFQNSGQANQSKFYVPTKIKGFLFKEEAWLLGKAKSLFKRLKHKSALLKKSY